MKPIQEFLAICTVAIIMAICVTVITATAITEISKQVQCERKAK